MKCQNSNINSIYYLSPSIDARMAIIQGKSVIEKARQIKRTLGTFIAARYLCKRQWSLEASLFLLAGA